MWTRFDNQGCGGQWVSSRFPQSRLNIDPDDYAHISGGPSRIREANHILMKRVIYELKANHRETDAGNVQVSDSIVLPTS
jgi:hypothetical protein